MPSTVELGVFLPIANNGWIISKTSPQFLPSFDHNARIVRLAEEIGFSYVFSMAKWRGFGGDVEFWKYSLESLILMAGLAREVARLRLIASVAPALIHPAVFAKMAATMDDVSGGRMGINIVSAANKGEYSQMGLYPENFDSFRYAYTTEWLDVVKRLWSEESVSYSGRYFNLEDCQSFPKPIARSMPIVCATSSEEGFQFVGAHCTDGFFGGTELSSKIARSRRIKEIAGSFGRSVKTQTLVTLILGETDQDAEKTFEYYESGADEAAIASIFAKRKGDKPDDRTEILRDRFGHSRSRIFYAGFPFVAGPERVADMLEELVVEGDVDGVMFIFPDFIDGLKRFDQLVMPLLRSRGLVRNARMAAAAPS
jgi:pyrimidine oxygenase